MTFGRRDNIIGLYIFRDGETFTRLFKNAARHPWTHLGNILAAEFSKFPELRSFETKSGT